MRVSVNLQHSLAVKQKEDRNKPVTAVETDRSLDVCGQENHDNALNSVRHLLMLWIFLALCLCCSYFYIR